MSNSKRILSQEETKALALYFQASFIAVIAADRTKKFLEIIKETDKFKENRKNIRKYVKRTEDYISQLHRAVFDTELQKVQEYLDLAAYFAKEEIVQQCTIKNNFTFFNVKEADLAAAHLHAYFLCTLSELIITEGDIETLANQMGVYSANSNCGISAIRKNLYDIAEAYDIEMPKEAKLKQVFMAYTQFEEQFISNEELLFAIVKANGLNVVPS